MKQGPYSIELTPEELSLAEAMEFDPLTFRGDHQSFQKNADLAHRLMTALLERGGIPEHRVRFFTDPDYYPGGRGKSRKEGFERNGTSGDELLRHPNFLRYIRYFLHGADLPPTVLSVFAKAVEKCGPISSGDIAPLGSTARQLARIHRLEPKAAADEFYKLSLDLGISAMYAGSIRSSVQQLKPARLY